jgi:hypothetical protein
MSGAPADGGRELDKRVSAALVMGYWNWWKEMPRVGDDAPGRMRTGMGLTAKLARSKTLGSHEFLL